MTLPGCHLRVQRVAGWGDCDPAGICYTPRLFEWVTETVERFFMDALHNPWHELRERRGLASPFARMALDFLNPIAVGNEVTIVLSIDGIGRSSLTWRIAGQVHAQRCFAGHAVTVFVDPTDNSPVSVPDDILRRVSELARTDTEGEEP